ncbi:hypothetical protein [Photorhabdus laumondii]|uniref:hypothetical protein n=1 Tax=Photorhabdus laumondii TaxID=2218628 RepID=UPI00331477C4
MEELSFPVARTPFILGCPEDLPVSEEGLKKARTLANHVLAQLNAAQVWQDTATLIQVLDQLLQQLPSASCGIMTDDPRENQENKDNDEAFNIERHHGECLALLISATLEATVQVCELTEKRGTSLTQEEWSAVTSTVKAILHIIVDPRALPQQHDDLPLPAGFLPEDTADPLRRWVRGHLLFMVLCQGMSLSLNLMITAAKDNDRELAVAQANKTIELMNIAQITLKFATDLSKEQYLEQIRPTLMPPIAPPKMSGINWRDHVVMIRIMRQSTDTWSFIEQTHPETVQRMRSALSDIYTAHRGVCEMFVGESTTSLLARKNATVSAGQVLEGLKQSRLKSLNTMAHEKIK